MARRLRPPQEQHRQPLHIRAAGKLSGKAALVAGGDSGIGSAVAFAFAREGADVAIVYFNDHRNAEEMRQRILRENVRCILIAGDIAKEDFCRNAVKRTIAAFRRLDILVNNVTEQQPDQGGRLASTDLLGMFYLTKAAMPHLRPGSAIINTTAVAAWRDSAQLIADAATSGTIVSFTRSIARALVARRIRVNAVTPVSVSAREEIAASYVFLAAQHGSFTTGQVLHARADEAAA
jgi:NAD(P)-dependent dehydrogenase (short-subunit alcohol dehydrogenase family)